MSNNIDALRNAVTDLEHKIVKELDQIASEFDVRFDGIELTSFPVRAVQDLKPSHYVYQVNILTRIR